MLPPAHSVPCSSIGAIGERAGDADLDSATMQVELVALARGLGQAVRGGHPAFDTAKPAQIPPLPYGARHMPLVVTAAIAALAGAHHAVTRRRRIAVAAQVRIDVADRIQPVDQIESEPVGDCGATRASTPPRSMPNSVSPRASTPSRSSLAPLPSGSLPCESVAPESGSITPYAPWLPLSPTTTSACLPPIVIQAAPEASGTSVEATNGSCSQCHGTASDPAATTGGGCSVRRSAAGLPHATSIADSTTHRDTAGL